VVRDLQDPLSTLQKLRSLSGENIELEPSYPLQVAGQAFFITSGEPMCFWGFSQIVWAEMGHGCPSWTINIPMRLGKEPGFTENRIYYATAHRWFNIEKARRVLGYELGVGVGEGIKRVIIFSNVKRKRPNICEVLDDLVSSHFPSLSYNY